MKYVSKEKLKYYNTKVKDYVANKKDNSTIINNSNDKFEVVGIKDQKTLTVNKMWTGTIEEYNAIANKDSSTFYYITDGTETNNGDGDCEKLSNKVNTINSSSTDTQYPSAKCVYDLVGDIERLLGGI